MKAQVGIFLIATLISSPVFAKELGVVEKDIVTGREVIVLSQEESRSFFRPKTMEDVREIASVDQPEASTAHVLPQESDVRLTP